MSRQFTISPRGSSRHREIPRSTNDRGIYLRALATLPNVHVREGFFLLKTSRQPKVQPLNPANPKIPNPANRTVEIWLNEEKGSDVNLATQLLLDAFDGNFDLAVVISNDSDLAWPILKVRTKFKRNVGVYKPERPAGYPSAVPRRDSKGEGEISDADQATDERQTQAALRLAALRLVEREVDELSLTIREPTEGQHHVPLVVGRQIKFGAIRQCATIVRSTVVGQDRFFHQLDSQPLLSG